jgi:hypothetical protein
VLNQETGRCEVVQLEEIGDEVYDNSIDGNLDGAVDLADSDCLGVAREPPDNTDDMVNPPLKCFSSQV